MEDKQSQLPEQTVNKFSGKNPPQVQNLKLPDKKKNFRKERTFQEST